MLVVLLRIRIFMRLPKKRNFRNKLRKAAVVEPTPHFRNSGGRPARLYRFKANAVAEVKTRRLFP